MKNLQIIKMKSKNNPLVKWEEYSLSAFKKFKNKKIKKKGPKT